MTLHIMRSVTGGPGYEGGEAEQRHLELSR